MDGAMDRLPITLIRRSVAREIDVAFGAQHIHALTQPTPSALSSHYTTLTWHSVVMIERQGHWLLLLLLLTLPCCPNDRSCLSALGALSLTIVLSPGIAAVVSATSLNDATPAKMDLNVLLSVCRRQSAAK